MFRHALLTALAAVLATLPASAQSLYPFSVGTSGDQEALSVAVDDAGAAYVVGTFANAPDFDPGAGTTTLTTNGGFDVFVAKYDALGALDWAFNVGGPSIESVESVAVTTDGGVAITGRFSGGVDFDPDGGTTLTAIGGNDVFVAKYTAGGALDWAFAVGGLDEDRGLGIAATANGGVVVAGAFSGTADFDPGAGTALLTPTGDDVFVARYDADGAYEWAFRVGGSGGDAALGVAVAPDGDVAVAGTFEDAVDFDPSAGTATATATGNNTNAFVASYTGGGAFQWVSALTSPANNRAVDVAAAADGSVYVTGDLAEPTAFGGGVTVTPTSDLDAFLARYDAAGAVQWAFGVGGFSTGLGVAAAPGGDVVFTGRFNGFIPGNDFDPGPDAEPLTGNGGTEVFVARYGANSAFEWAFAATGATGNSNEQGNAVAIDDEGNAVVVGFFQTEEAGETITFEFAGGETRTLTNSGGNDLFVAKYAPDGALVTPAEPGAVPALAALSAPSPNPVRGAARLHLTLPHPQHVRVEVFDAVGRRVATLHEGNLAAGETPFGFEAGGLPSGVYVIRATGDGFVEAVRATVVQ